METCYKGFNEELQSTRGRGVFQWEIGKWYEADGDAKCHRNGFHCAENPLDCLRVYPYNGQNRYFLVEIDGEIDDEGSEISASRMRLVEELTIEELLIEAVRYAVRHPKDNQRLGTGEQCRRNDVVIVLSENPVVHVQEAPVYAGMIQINQDGKPIKARAFKLEHKGIFGIEGEYAEENG